MVVAADREDVVRRAHGNLGRPVDVLQQLKTKTMVMVVVLVVMAMAMMMMIQPAGQQATQATPAERQATQASNAERQEPP